MTDVEKLIIKKIDDIAQKLDRINGRTRSLENWRAYTVGGMTIIGFIIAYIINKI